MARGLTVVVLALGLAGCGGSGSPAAPSPVPQVAPQATAFQVKGAVLDTAGRAVVDATVEVLTGPQAGISTTSAAGGAFSLTGAFDGNTRFRATSEGHVTVTQSFNSIAVTRSIYFLMELLEPPVNIAGRYTVTFVADEACANQLPDALRTRTYAATIAPDLSASRPANTVFTATLSDASLDAYFHTMWILVAGDYLYFDLSDNSILEEVAPETYLEIGGVGAASVGTSGLSTIAGSFRGVFDYSGESVAHAQCQSTNHRLTLTRR